jgi:hypothetical protein
MNLPSELALLSVGVRSCMPAVVVVVTQLVTQPAWLVNADGGSASTVDSNRRPIHYEIVLLVATACYCPRQVPYDRPLNTCERPLRRVCSGTNLARMPRTGPASSASSPGPGEPLLANRRIILGQHR